MSIDGAKKASKLNTLGEFFHMTYGTERSRPFKRARKAFVESLAGYSLFCFLIQVKDRHNGNILVDSVGHLIHIDFGFMISNSPGKGINFEQAPFKLT
jgi:phosphatidylinositol kinase/protein kinase (PI-3  family)